jgi:hypothetical protein
MLLQSRSHQCVIATNEIINRQQQQPLRRFYQAAAAKKVNCPFMIWTSPPAAVPARLPGQDGEYKYLSALELEELHEAEPHPENDFFIDEHGKKYLDRVKLQMVLSNLLEPGRTFSCIGALERICAGICK